ncbi:MAG: hypothetical protein ACJ789_16715 [Thermomicrobiales bacterium]
MDGHPFDRLSRNLAAGVSRRVVLQGVVAMAGTFLSTLSATRVRAASNVGVSHHTGPATNPVVYIE